MRFVYNEHLEHRGRLKAKDVVHRRFLTRLYIILHRHYNLRPGTHIWERAERGEVEGREVGGGGCVKKAVGNGRMI